jgi:hypothetical protein
MQQHLHLLILDPERHGVLAGHYGTRWLLPSIRCDERLRAGPAIARWCADRCICGDVAGQWLGRAGTHAIDWLVPILTRQPLSSAEASLAWTPLDALAGGKSVLDYQTWALARSLERSIVPAVPGPFGNLDWPDRVRTWLRNSLGLTVAGWTAYRTSAQEVVLGVDTPSGRIYFKGLTGNRATEALVTRRFSEAAPESFARTIALEPRSDGTTWWVTAECRGRAANDLTAVATALARLQHYVLPLAQDPALLEKADLVAACEWAGEAHRPIDRAIPGSWIPMDLDPTNVLIDGDRVQFIDLDDSFFGPAPLAMAAFALRGDGVRTAAYAAYERSWPPSLAAVEWRHLEKAAVVFQAWRGWVRVMRNVERGELDADLDRVRTSIRAGLTRHLYRG